jgi:hypothetical protein
MCGSRHMVVNAIDNQDVIVMSAGGHRESEWARSVLKILKDDTTTVQGCI